MRNPSVNRYLKDKVFDHIDHALGRPIQPLLESYRNYFSTGDDCDLAEVFRASDFWDEGRTYGDSTYFYVNEAGRKALDDYLNEIGDEHRLFEVVVSDGGGRTHSSFQVATTHSGAKYKWYMAIDSCEAFEDYLRYIRSVRVLTPKRKPAEKYYICDVRSHWRGQKYVTFWRPENAGYAYPLSWSGKYTKAEIEEHPFYYWSLRNGCKQALDRFPVKCSVVDKLAIAPEPGRIDGDAGPVVENTPENLRKLKRAAYRPLAATQSKEAQERRAA